MKKKSLLLLLLLILCTCFSYAQAPVKVGSGSYAEYTPLYKSRTSERNGDQSQIMQNRKLYITDKNIGTPIPTNDWWTDLLVSQYSGNLWSYPQVVNAEEYGFYVAYPKEWEATGHELKWNSQIQISGTGFKPASALANNWHDWGLDFVMKDGDKEMLVTTAHGIPFTWVESKNLSLQLQIGDGTLSDANGQELILPFTTNKFTIDIDGDVYAIFAPDGTNFSRKNDQIQVVFANNTQQYLSIGVLPSKADLNSYATYAYTIPRNTQVTWDYNESTGDVKTTWTLQTENLKGLAQDNVLQGFIPHQYKNSTLNFGFTNFEYQTPRGKMKMAAGNSFDITYKFNGMLPFFANPIANGALKNPYQKQRMKQMISDYADKGNFGGDTYWGGKGLIQMAMYMTFAHEMGETALFEKCKNRLKDALSNWLTYTPGENNFFFARYQRWGALIGYDTSYDSDTFNDHHFHYGYFTLASGILALFDDDFKEKYGHMATLVAKDYANWDRNDTSFPLFRTLDPWEGHSYAGGLGGANGNGQESTSEAMQSWAGMYMLGVATGNREMRDAGIFGWTLEARGTAEYWFDRDKENIDYTRYTKPYNSNLTSQGIGWWTWFSGDPVWMHSIQWLPMTPGLKYLYEDLNFAEWDYSQMWDKKEIKGWETQLGQQPSALSYESGIGNVVLSYLQIFNPDSAASVFDKMWDAEMPLARNTDTGGITYFITHSHRTYGDICWDIHADVPTATTYKHPITGVLTYMVYNPEDSEKKVKFYKNGSEILEISVPAKKLTVYSDSPVATNIKILAENNSVVEPNTSTTLKAVLLDQYGATMEGVFSWSASGNSTVNNQGVFTASSTTGEAIVTVSAGSLSKTITLTINELPKLTTAVVLPKNLYYLEKGTTVNFSLEMKDQYNQPYLKQVDWKILKGTEEVKADSVLDVDQIGIYTIKASIDGQTYNKEVYITPKFRNIALGKPVYSSSEENAGTGTINATDGSYSTRWGSQHSDPQWIYVDLQSSSFISYMSLVWEPAYASLYEIQISDDAADWETVKTVNGLGNTELIEINKTARYIRMNGISRATTYGFSLYEFEVYGVPPVGNTPMLFGIEVTPSFTQIKENETVNLTAKGYDQFGNEFPISPQFVLQKGEGAITTTGSFTPSKYGEAVVQVKANDLTANAKLVVEETIKLTTVKISPQKTSLIKGESLTFMANAKDQFGVDFPSSDLAYSIIEGDNGQITGNTFSSNSVGEYKIVVSNGGTVKDTAIVTVAELSEVNLALHKPVGASSFENDGTLPQYVNDGVYNTRWGSTFKDNEYIQVDLEDNFVINKIKIFWDPAYSTAYQILVSTDNENWDLAYSTTTGKGSNEVIDISSIAGRYIRVLSLTRNTVYGSSINELEVFGTAFWKNPVPTSIVVNPSPLIAYIGSNLKITANVYDQYGLSYTGNETTSWSVNGGGTIDQQGDFSPQNAGKFILNVSYGALAVDYSLTVKTQKILTKIVVNATSTLVKTNEQIQLTLIGYDQYGELFDISAPVNWSSNGGNITSNGQFFATAAGQYQITATSGAISASINIEAFVADNQNLALNKPIEVSSGGNGNGAVDGNLGSRWESTHGNNDEWFIVDLQDAYHLTNVQIFWEAASASDYDIELSKDGQHWSAIKSVKGVIQTGNRTDDLQVAGMGRYIRFKGIKRLTQWGYSVFEFKAFGKKLEDNEPYTIEFINPVTQIIDEAPVKYNAKVFNKNHTEIINQLVQWRVSGVGNIDANGWFTSNVDGNATIVVSSLHAEQALSISYTAQQPLAIAYLKSLTAVLQNSAVNINWKMALGTSNGSSAFETTNSSFILQRSGDGVNFETLTAKKINAQNGLDSYNYTDRNPLKGTNYYRLSHLDLNGKLTVLGIKYVDFSLQPSEVKVYPVPADQIINIKGDNIKSVAIFSLNGKLELETTQTHGILVSHLPAGIYILKIIKENGAVYPTKITIIH